MSKTPIELRVLIKQNVKLEPAASNPTIASADAWDGGQETPVKRTAVERLTDHLHREAMVNLIKPASA